MTARNSCLKTKCKKRKSKNRKYTTNKTLDVRKKVNKQSHKSYIKTSGAKEHAQMIRGKEFKKKEGDHDTHTPNNMI